MSFHSVVPKCRGNYDKNSKVSTFKFPDYPELRKIWIHAIKRVGFTPSDPSRVIRVKNERRFTKVRYVQLTLYGVMGGFIFGSRSLMPIAIVAMTTPNTSNNPDVPVYNWTNNSIILSSFYWSYAIVQFFVGWIGHSHGPKWYLASAIFTEAITDLFMPQMANSFGANGVMAFRVLQGLAQGVVIPLKMQLLGRWAPTDERTWMTSVMILGNFFGPVLTKFTSGFIAATWAGWPVLFYGYGVFGMFACLVWSIFGYNSPAEHTKISEKERKHIEVSLGQDESIEMKLIPWKTMFSSLPFWSIIIAAIGESWVSTLLATETPTYLAKVTSLDITSNGLFLTVPHLVAGVANFLYGPIIDYSINRGAVSRANARRIFNGIASFVPAVTLIILTYVSHDHHAVLVLLVISFVAKSAVQSYVNILDISPRFSGVLMGIANGIGQFVAMFAPVCVQYIVHHESEANEWRIVFILTAAILVTTGIFYTIFMSGKRQSWDALEQTSEIHIRDT